MSDNNKSPVKLACPTCQKDVFWNEDFPDRPFCSERCKLIDLGEWANESHKIEGNSQFDDVLSDDLEGGEFDR